MSYVLDQIIYFIRKSYGCLREAAKNVSWLKYFEEVQSLAFTHHRAMIFTGLLQKIPESQRPVFTPEILPMRKGLVIEYYIGSECADVIKEAISRAQAVAMMFYHHGVIDRTIVGIARLCAYIERVVGYDTILIPPKDLMKLLSELEIHIQALKYYTFPTEASPIPESGASKESEAEKEEFT